MSNATTINIIPDGRRRQSTNESLPSTSQAAELSPIAGRRRSPPTASESPSRKTRFNTIENKSYGGGFGDVAKKPLKHHHSSKKKLCHKTNAKCKKNNEDQEINLAAAKLLKSKTI